MSPRRQPRPDPVDPSPAGEAAAASGQPARRSYRLLAAVVSAGVILDQVTKQLAEASLRGRGTVSVLDGVFELRHTRNPGAFFSLGAELSPGLRRVVFVAASAAATYLIVRLYAQADRTQRALRWALALLLAGAAGNLIDRLIYGEVIDFVHLYYRGVFDWATFNVADALIVAGLALLAVDLLRPGHAVAHDARQAEPEAPTERTT